MQIAMFVIGGIALAIFVVAGSIAKSTFGYLPSERYRIQVNKGIFLGVRRAFFVVGVYCAIVLFDALTLLLMRHLKIRERNIFIATGIVLVGAGAFALKRKNKRWFGIFELGFAWFSAVAISLDVKKDITFAEGLGIVGTVYLVAESLEYYFDGKKKIGDNA